VIRIKSKLTKARKIAMLCVVVVVVALMILLIIGYTQPMSGIRVEVYNCWIYSTEVSFTIYIDDVTDGQVYHLPSLAQKVLGVWSVHAGNHNVSLVSDDFPKMVYNTKVLSRSVVVWPYETTTAYWALAGQ